jgi:hypothetical protein
MIINVVLPTMPGPWVLSNVCGQIQGRGDDLLILIGESGVKSWEQNQN